MMALSARWQAPRECGMSISGGGPPERRTPFSLNRWGRQQDAGEGGGGGGRGRGCDPVLQGAWRNLFGHRIDVAIHVYVRLVLPRKASFRNNPDLIS